MSILHYRSPFSYQSLILLSYLLGGTLCLAEEPMPLMPPMEQMEQMVENEPVDNSAPTENLVTTTGDSPAENSLVDLPFGNLPGNIIDTIRGGIGSVGGGISDLVDNTQNRMDDIEFGQVRYRVPGVADSCTAHVFTTIAACLQRERSPQQRQTIDQLRSSIERYHSVLRGLFGVDGFLTGGDAIQLGGMIINHVDNLAMQRLYSELMTRLPFRRLRNRRIRRRGSPGRLFNYAFGIGSGIYHSDYRPGVVAQVDQAVDQFLSQLQEMGLVANQGSAGDIGNIDITALREAMEQIQARIDSLLREYGSFSELLDGCFEEATYDVEVRCPIGIPVELIDMAVSDRAHNTLLCYSEIVEEEIENTCPDRKLGIDYRVVTKSGANGRLQYWAEVTYVCPGSPAARVGIEVGDVLETINGFPVGGFAEDVVRQRIQEIVGALEFGVSTNIVWHRRSEAIATAASDWQRMEGMIIVGQHQITQPTIIINIERRVSALGITFEVVEYPRADGARVYYPVVRSVAPGSPAATAGIQPDQVLRSINGVRVGDIEVQQPDNKARVRDALLQAIIDAGHEAPASIVLRVPHESWRLFEVSVLLRDANLGHEDYPWRDRINSSCRYTLPHELGLEVVRP